MSIIFSLDYFLQEDGAPCGQGHFLPLIIYLLPHDLATAWHTVEAPKMLERVQAPGPPLPITSCFEGYRIPFP